MKFRLKNRKFVAIAILTTALTACGGSDEHTPASPRTDGPTYTTSLEVPLRSGTYATASKDSFFIWNNESRSFSLLFQAKKTLEYNSVLTKESRLAQAPGAACWIEVTGRLANPDDKPVLQPERKLNANYVLATDIGVHSYRDANYPEFKWNDLLTSPLLECAQIASNIERATSLDFYLPVLAGAEQEIVLAHWDCQTLKLCETHRFPAQTYLAAPGEERAIVGWNKAGGTSASLY